MADYLDYAADLKGLSNDDKRTEIRRAIGATQLGVKLDSPISTLSRGFKQRVGVAQAILGRPRLLILDEPTNGLDPSQTQQMRELIREISREATVILSTHILQEVDALCDRVLIVSAGRLAVDERLDELRRGNRLLLEASAAPGIREISGVAAVEDAGKGSYHIALEAAADPRAVAASVAGAVVQGGGELYRLQPEQRNLEALFREVNGKAAADGKEELSHAA